MILVTSPEGVLLGTRSVQEQATQLAFGDAMQFLFGESAKRNNVPSELCEILLEGWLAKYADVTLEEFLQVADTAALEIADRLRARMAQYKFEEFEI